MRTEIYHLRNTCFWVYSLTLGFFPKAAVYHYVLTKEFHAYISSTPSRKRLQHKRKLQVDIYTTAINCIKLYFSSTLVFIGNKQLFICCKYKYYSTFQKWNWNWQTRLEQHAMLYSFGRTYLNSHSIASVNSRSVKFWSQAKALCSSHSDTNTG